MLTFNVILGYQGLLFRDFFFFFFVFFQSDRPTDPISENAFDANNEKNRDGLNTTRNYGEQCEDCIQRESEGLEKFALTQVIVSNISTFTQLLNIRVTDKN